MSLWLRINGIPATEIAAHTPPSWETLADGGCGEASFALALSQRSQHSALFNGALVEILAGPLTVYRGLLTEPDRTTWECHAAGFYSALHRRIAIDSLGAATRDLGSAISEAIARGWPGTNPAPVAGTAAGDATGNAVKVGNLLDDYATQTGQRWGVDGLGQLYMRPDPTSPRWLFAPDAAAFGVTDESVADFLAGTYFDGADNQTAFAGSGDNEDTVDLTDRGTLTLAAAQAILAGMMTRDGTVSWTNGVTLHREQITTSGGTPAALTAIRGGHMVRAHGLSYGAVSRSPWLDVTIGKTKYTAGEDTIYLEPINTAPRNYIDVQAAA